MLHWLLSSADFVPRDGCGAWTPGMVRLYQTANVTIALAYLLIPVALGVLWYARRDAVRGSSILLLFVAFILLCGSTHLLNALAFRWPAYRFFVVVDTVTAFVSISTACVLPLTVKHLLGYDSPEQKRQKIRELSAQLEENQRLRAEMEEKAARLVAECQNMQDAIDSARYRASKAELVQGLRERLAAIKESQVTPPSEGPS